MRTLLEQRFAGTFEVIVVASADDPAALPTPVPDSRLRFEARVPRLPAAHARNLGATLASGELLVFVDADAWAPTTWLEHLVAASEGRWCVAGAIANGTPHNPCGTAEYLVEFYDLAPARRDPSEHGATCNLLVPRRLWQRYGPFPDDLEGCEDTWLTRRLQADGLLRFSRFAAVRHLNRTRLREVLRHQHALGGAHARLAARTGELGSTRSSVKLTAGRVRYLYGTMRSREPRALPGALSLAPLVLATFAAWGAGYEQEAGRLRSSGGPRASDPA